MNSIFNDGLSRRQVIQRAAAAASFSALAESFADAQTASPSGDATHHTSKEDFVQLMTELSNWNRWGKDDQMGAVNLITPAKRKQAVALVKEGACFSMARNAEMEKAVDNPAPIVRKMLRTRRGGARNRHRQHHGFVFHPVSRLRTHSHGHVLPLPLGRQDV